MYKCILITSMPHYNKSPYYTTHFICNSYDDFIKFVENDYISTLSDMIERNYDTSNITIRYKNNTLDKYTYDEFIDDYYEGGRFDNEPIEYHLFQNNIYFKNEPKPRIMFARVIQKFVEHVKNVFENPMDF